MMSKIDHSITTHNFHFMLNGEKLSFLLKRSDRRRTLQISIKCDQSIVVHAPQKLPDSEIQAFLESRRSWIQKHLSNFKQVSVHKATYQWINGEIHYYLGQPYSLKIQSGDRPMVELDHHILWVTVKNIEDVEEIQKWVTQWYENQAKNIFPTRLSDCLQKSQAILKLPQKTVPLRIKTMKTLWGSCSSLGRISLNLKLIKMPPICLDYVIIHELCHFREMNHSPKFWQLVSQCMPNWREAKAIIKQTNNLID